MKKSLNGNMVHAPRKNVSLAVLQSVTSELAYAVDLSQSRCMVRA